MKKYSMEKLVENLRKVAFRKYLTHACVKKMLAQILHIKLYKQLKVH